MAGSCAGGRALPAHHEPAGRGVLVVDMTMTDAVFYTRPVTGQKKWVEVPNGHLLPYDCAKEGWHKRIEQLERSATPRR